MASTPGGMVSPSAIYLSALREGLKDYGYVDGQNVRLEMRFPAEQYDRFFILARELVALKPDLIVTAAGIAAIAAAGDQNNSDCFYLHP